MTHQTDYTSLEELTDVLSQQGWGAIPELLRILVNQAMVEERAKFLQVEAYERSAHRTGHANGYKPKTVKTRVGVIPFAVPQVREGGFYPAALEKGLRSERALVMTLAEMVVQGVSTRKVKEITAQLCGFEVSARRSAEPQPNWMPFCRRGASSL